MIRIVSTFLFICLAINKGVLAQSSCQNDVFGLSGIAIDKTAPTANEAQVISMAEAHQTALSVVLNRLLIDTPPDGLVDSPESVVELVHIRTETSLPGRYIAEIDICFAPSALREIFETNQLAWAEVQSPPILVVPVYSDGAGIRAWQMRHPWLAGWRKAVSQRTGLLRYKLLEPTLLNERQLRAEKLISADRDTLQKAADRAKADQILVVRALVGLVDDKPQLSMEGVLYDAKGQLITSVATAQHAGGNSDYTAKAQDFYETVLQKLEDSWQNANIRREGLSNKLIARIAFTSHERWVEKQVKLAQLPAISTIETTMIKASDNVSAGRAYEAIVLLQMNGSVEALRYGLAPLGLTLRLDGEMAVIE